MSKQFYNNTISITYSESVENHAGMQIIGEKSDQGFTIKELEDARDKFIEDGFKATIYRLDTFEDQYYEGYADDNQRDIYLESVPGIHLDAAAILVVRRGVDAFVNKDDFFNEQITFVDRVDPKNHDKETEGIKVDTKAKMRGRVVNKHARWNLCFTNNAQSPDYESGKGTVVDFKDVPCLSVLKDDLYLYFGDKVKKLYAEGNYYYDVDGKGRMNSEGDRIEAPNQSYIGLHGDGERRIVICARLGEPMPLYYRWFHQTEPYGDVMEFNLKHGDLYAMSDKAVGFDWKQKNIYTLRHAVGNKDAKALKKMFE